MIGLRRPDFVAEQGLCPHGLLGRLIARVMARQTAADNKKAIALLGLKETDRVLDVGACHGRSLGLIASLAPQGRAVGIDASRVALSVATARNRSLINACRVFLEQARSDALPFGDGQFDKAMAVHTLYFWRPAEPHVREIARVLRPHGKFVLGFRPADDEAGTRRFPAAFYGFRTVASVEALLTAMGFGVCRKVARESRADTMVWIVARKRPRIG
jgi:SAM-dependent methyltransferase